MIKRMITSVFLIVVLFLVSGKCFVQAESSHLNSNWSIKPMYNTVCGSYDHHRMEARGTGTVYKLDKTRYIYMGCAWQCSRCMLVMVTEGDLWYWGMDPIGKYAISGEYPYKINNNGCVIYGADYYGYTSDNYLDGYKFYLKNKY